VILLPVEGLLAPSHCVDSLRGAAPVPEAQVLYSLLVSSGEPVSLVSSQRSRQAVEDWLALEGFTRWVQLHHRGTSSLEWTEFRVSVIMAQLAIGRTLKFYVDSDPHLVRLATDAGVSSLLLVDPAQRVGRAGSNQQSYLAWDTLVDTIETRSQAQANLAAKGVDTSED
jgi:hypothetical protein